MTLREFLSWGAQYKNFPYGQIAYWIDAAERQDGKDMYGRALEPDNPHAARSDEDKIRDAMAEAQEHPGRVVTR